MTIPHTFPLMAGVSSPRSRTGTPRRAALDAVRRLTAAGENMRLVGVPPYLLILAPINDDTRRIIFSTSIGYTLSPMAASGFETTEQRRRVGDALASRLQHGGAAKLTRTSRTGHYAAGAMMFTGH